MGGQGRGRGVDEEVADHVLVSSSLVASGRNTAGLEQGDIVLLKCFSPNKF